MMNHMRTLFLLFPVVYLSCNSGAISDRYNVRGRITGLKGSKVYVQAYVNDEFRWIDSSLIRDESFELTGSVNEPHRVTLWFTNAAGINEPLCSTFYLENRKITLKGDINHRGNIQLTGAVETKIMKKLDSATAFPPRYEMLRNIFYRAELNNQSLPADSVNGWYSEIKTMEIARAERIRETVKKHAGSYAALETIGQNITAFTVQDLKKLKPFFSNLHQCLSYKKTFEMIDEKADLSVGSAFKDFTLRDSLDKIYSLSAFHSKWLLIDIWASWCGPCRRQIPVMKALYEKSTSYDLTIVGISIDHDHDKWKEALIQEQMNWTHLIAPDRHWAFNNYLINAVPCYILLDSSRHIVAAKITLSEVEDILKNGKVQ